MRLRDQLIGAVALAAVTYYGLVRIAEAKCDAAAGSRGLSLDERHPEDLAAFRRLQSELTRMGQSALGNRLERLRQRGDLWVAPGIGPDRWAAYVESLGLVHRIYIRQLALLHPIAHLYPNGAQDVPYEYQAAFAWLSLGGAMRHELAHYDGAVAEADAYAVEIRWYEEIRHSSFFNRQEVRTQDAWRWALESAVASARKAAERAGVDGSS